MDNLHKCWRDMFGVFHILYLVSEQDTGRVRYIEKTDSVRGKSLYNMKGTGRLRHLEKPENVKTRIQPLQSDGLIRQSDPVLLLTGSFWKNKDHPYLHSDDYFWITQLCKFPQHIADSLTLLPILKRLEFLGFSDITSLLRKADRNYNIIISKGRKLGGVMTKEMRSCC